MVSNFPAMVLVNFIILFAGGVLCFLFFYGCGKTFEFLFFYLLYKKFYVLLFCHQKDPYKTLKILNKNQTGTYWLYLVLSEHAIGLTGILFSSIICYSMVQHSSGKGLLQSI